MPTPKPPTDPSFQRTRIRLDWKAYFIEFCKAHGEPVLHAGRLLFRDGWSYSSTAYEGPEFAPPPNPDDLDRLVLQYWLIRQSTISKAIIKLQHEHDHLKSLEASRSVPLQQVTYVQDGEHRRRAYKPIDLTPIMQRILWMKDDLQECADRLKEIYQYHEQRRTDNESVREGLESA